MDRLAALLNLPTSELDRALTEEELDDWDFYRTSARQSRLVWAHVGKLIKQHNIPIAQAAEAVGLTPPALSNAISLRRPTNAVLDKQAAARLADLMGLQGGPATFIHPDPNEHSPDR